MITLTSRSGRFVQTVNCRRAPFGYDQRLEALSEREMLSVANRRQSELLVASSAGFNTTPPQSYFIERFAEVYRAEMAGFLDLLRDGMRLLAGLAEGLEAQRLSASL